MRQSRAKLPGHQNPVTEESKDPKNVKFHRKLTTQMIDAKKFSRIFMQGFSKNHAEEVTGLFLAVKISLFET